MNKIHLKRLKRKNKVEGKKIHEQQLIKVFKRGIKV